MSTEREQVEALAALMQEAAELPQLDGARLILESALLAEVKAAARAEELRNAADFIDSGPTFPMAPHIFSALLRERADDIDTRTRVARSTP